MRTSSTLIPRQLNLPFAATSQRCWTVSVGKKRKNRVSLEIQLHAWGASARLFGPYPTPIGEPRRVLLWEIEFRVRPPVVLRSSHPFATQAWFESPARRGKKLHAVFKAALSCAIRSFRFKWSLGKQSPKQDSDRNEDVEPERVMARSERKAAERARRNAKRRAKEQITFEPMRRALQELQAHVLRRLVPRARRAAARFAKESPVRLMVYRLVADDPTGRVEQISRTCPGVLLMMSHLERQKPDAFPELLEMIVAGVRLPKIIARVVELWEACCPSIHEHTEDMRGNQRLRIRKATAGVLPDHLWKPFLGKMSSEDIPRSARANRIWFLVSYALMKGCESYDILRLQDSVPEWVSRCALELAGIWGTNLETLTWRFFDLADYLCCEERTPQRKTSPRQLINECTAWHEDLERQRKPLPLHEKMNPGPTAGFSLWETRHGYVRFLETAGDLYDEGKRMGHCISSHAKRAMNGTVQVFHGDFAGERATIEISCAGWNPSLIEARGFANSSLSSKAMRAIGRWLDDLREHMCEQLKQSCRDDSTIVCSPQGVSVK